MSDLLSDPDTFARSVVQQYLHEHGMHSGTLELFILPKVITQSTSGASTCIMLVVSTLLSSLPQQHFRLWKSSKGASLYLVRCQLDPCCLRWASMSLQLY